MTKDEIIEMAIQAGFDEHHAKFDTRIKAFAKLIAEKKREACALLCYEQRKNWDVLACADAIRAGTRPRGQA